MVDSNFNKELKAKTLALTKKVIRVYGTAPGKERFTVIGENDTYDTVYDSRMNKWTCSCPNIRNTNCYHMIACAMVAGRWYKDYEGGKTDSEIDETPL